MELRMALKITWRGASGKSYTFETYPIGTRFNPMSGVYIFCREIISGSWEALYVGETQSLEQRLNAGIRSHDGYVRALQAGATHIAAIVVAGDAERLGIETDLRHGLNPSANAQSVLGALR
jgi:excinuclease UvrABC nuclease subunit